MTLHGRTDEDIVAGYLAHHATGDDSLFWAFEDLSEILSDDPERAWRLTLQLISQSSNEAVLAYVAAGPLEDLLAYHGHRFIERIEAQSKTDAVFHQALCGVWGQGRFDPEIYDRVQHAIRFRA